MLKNFNKDYLSSIISILIVFSMTIGIVGFVFQDVYSETVIPILRKHTVYGDHRIRVHDVDLNPSVQDTYDASFMTYNTGLSFVFYAIPTLGPGATGAAITAVLNSNNGMEGSANGFVYLTYSGGQGLATGTVLTGGK